MALVASWIVSAPASASASITASRSDSTPSPPLITSTVVVTVIVGFTAEAGCAATTPSAVRVVRAPTTRLTIRRPL